MSKEVKLGLAIGGVLLSVLIVYALVISGSPTATEEVTLAVPETPAPAAVAPAAPTTPEPAPVTATQDPFAAPTPAPAPVEAAPPETPAAPPVAENTPPSGDDKWLVLHNGMPMTTETPQVQRPSTLDESGNTIVRPISASITPTPAALPPTPRATVDVPPTNAAAPSAAASTARTHVVKSGETFSSIAATAYGSSAYFAHLVRANAGVDPAKLRPGMVINIPALDQVRADRASGNAEPLKTLDPSSEYRVQGGDSLYKISMKLYGKPDRQDKLYEANKAAIGPDKAKLHIGMLLKLPEPPTVASR